MTPLRLRSLVLALVLAPALAPAPSRPETAMTPQHATGPFDVRVAPLALSPVAQPSGLVRMSLDKRYHGTLSATSQGEMLASNSGRTGSGGYVAMETVRGTLAGRSGSFVLQHSSTMAGGVATQSIVVAPDSGTGELVGLAGRMVIDIAPGGAHSYRFDYELPDAR